MKTLLEVSSLILIVFVAFIVWVIIGTPSANEIRGCVITNKYKVKLCPENKSYVNLQKVSSYMKDLVIISEDASFYSHKGFDFDELKNSLNLNLSRKRISRGGSTITQQLAKNVFLPFEKTFSRKIREAILTTHIEHILTKDQILEKYLNVIEFGKRVYGVGPASVYYFNKAATDLNLLEAAFLTYLVPNPKVYQRVYFNKQLTPYSQYRILDLCYRMYRFHKITLDQYIAAKKYVDLFPWKKLTVSQQNELSGHLVDSPDLESMLSPDDKLPESDSSLNYVDPSENESPFDE